MTYLYAITDENVLLGRAAVKLGISKTPNERLLELQTGNSRDLMLLSIRPIVSQQPEDYEKSVHATLEPWKIRGEWFDWSSEVQEWVQSNMLVPFFLVGRYELQDTLDLLALSPEDYFRLLGMFKPCPLMGKLMERWMKRNVHNVECTRELL